MAGPQTLTPKDLEEFLNGAFQGDPAEAQAWCERTMSPNHMRFSAGGDRTDFKSAVEKVALFRTVCRKWVAPVVFLVQDGNKVAARFTVEMVMGNEPMKKLELMFMAEMDDQGRFENVWELSSPIVEDGQ
jgi:hypothetical protein